MKTKIFVVFLAIIFLSAILFAQENATESSKKKIRIGLIGKSQSNPVFMAAYAGARVAAKTLGQKNNIDIVIDWKTPQHEDPQEQIKNVELLANSGVDGISIACSDGNALTESINNAVDKGINVICFDSDAAKSKRLLLYATDDKELGEMIVKELARVMNERGVIGIMAGNKNAPNLKRRTQAVIDAIKNYPNMSVASNGIIYHEEVPEKAAEALNKAQKANPNIGGWAMIGGWPLFVKDAVKWEPGTIKIVACDALPEQLEYLKSGHVQVLIAQDCFAWGYQSVEILINKIIFKTSSKTEFVASPLTKVTSENAEEWSTNWRKWLVKEAFAK